MTDSQLVSVIIPAYNAADTLNETLRSVRSQTHRALEIIVVDDGSTDDTRAIAEQHAAIDDRVQVVTQNNAGVATTRNEGWQRARSDLIAFVDADDLWAPTKIERQLQALQTGGQNVGLVYCWFARIDNQGSITSFGEEVRFEGDVLNRLFLGNFVGNGSSALVRRQALIDTHGFESRLRAASGEGCEDYLFYCRVAERYHFAVVPERLVGYRYLPNNMSSNRFRMLRSWLLVVNEMLARHPDHSDALKRGLRNYSNWLVKGLLTNNFRQISSVLLLLLRDCPSIALALLLQDIPVTLIMNIRDRLLSLYCGMANPMQAETGQRFLIGGVD